MGRGHLYNSSTTSDNSICLFAHCTRFFHCRMALNSVTLQRCLLLARFMTLTIQDEPTPFSVTAPTILLCCTMTRKRGSSAPRMQMLAYAHRTQAYTHTQYTHRTSLNDTSTTHSHLCTTYYLLCCLCPVELSWRTTMQPLLSN